MGLCDFEGDLDFTPLVLDQIVETLEFVRANLDPTTRLLGLAS